MGHSLGGKIAWKLAEKIHPKQVWILDSFPGTSKLSEFQGDAAHLMYIIKHIPLPIPSRKWLKDELIKHGFSEFLALWMTTNLKASLTGGGLSWKFNYDGIHDMFVDYLETPMWNFLDNPGNLAVHFVVAEKSERWNDDLREQLIASTVRSKGKTKVHILQGAGHWVHQDNPNGLYKLFDDNFLK